MVVSFLNKIGCFSAPMPIHAMPARCGAPPCRCGVIRRVASPFHCQSEQAAQGFSTANQIGASAKPCRAMPLRCISVHCIALPSRRISMLCRCVSVQGFSSALRSCSALCQSQAIPCFAVAHRCHANPFRCRSRPTVLCLCFSICAKQMPRPAKQIHS